MYFSTNFPFPSSTHFSPSLQTPISHPNTISPIYRHFLGSLLSPGVIYFASLSLLIQLATHLFFCTCSWHFHSLLSPPPPSLSCFLFRHLHPLTLCTTLTSSFCLSLGSRPITLACGSKERPRPRPIAGWSWRNPSRSSWTSLAMSHCSSLESCSTCPVFPGWSKKPPGEESPNATYSLSDIYVLFYIF